MSSNNEPLKPSGAVSPDSDNNDSDGERNASHHDRSRIDRGEEMHVIPSTSSTTGIGTRQITEGRGNATANSSDYHHADHAPDHVSSSSIDKSKKPPVSGKRRHKKKRSEMTAEEWAEADRKRKRTNLKTARESRQRRRAQLEQLRQEACELQAANFALIQENQTLAYYIKYYNGMIKKGKQGDEIVTDPFKLNNVGAGGGSPTTRPSLNNANMANNDTLAATVPQTSMPSMQVPTQMQQMQMPVHYQGAYNTAMTPTQSFLWQNQQQQIQQQMPVGQPMLMMNPQQSYGQGGMLWAQQYQQQQQQQQSQQMQGSPPDIYMHMAAILLNQAQQQQIQQQQIEQQQQHNQAMATAPTPSPWSQFPNGETPVINPTNIAQIDANALISQIMNYWGAGSGWNNGQQEQMPQATTEMAQPQQPFFPVSSSQPMRYGQASTTGTPNMHSMPGYQQSSRGRMQAANTQTEAQSMPSIFPNGGRPQNDTSTTRQQRQQQDDPSFSPVQLQSLGLPDGISINLQNDTHDDVLDDDLSIR